MNAQACCGYAAAVVSILAFGSFAVPIKCQAARKVSVDPLGTFLFAAAMTWQWCGGGHMLYHVRSFPSILSQCAPQLFHTLSL